VLHAFRERLPPTIEIVSFANWLEPGPDSPAVKGQLARSTLPLPLWIDLHRTDGMPSRASPRDRQLTDRFWVG